MSVTRNVSVLFTDLVGSTALSSSVSPDVADGLRREHFGVLRQVVAETGGTEVKNLGDGVMVVFSTASGALACAVGMQQATDADNRGRDVPFGLRVGVSGGEVTEEDGDFFGDPVVEAARLCARCDSGQVLVADVVRAMAGRRSVHEFVSVGDLELKGLPEPVATVEVRWEPVTTAVDVERVPLPAGLAAAPASGLVGRADERGELLSAFKAVSAGEGRRLVVVAGEAGLGKTTLVSDVAREAFEAGACVLFGHAEEGLTSPYGLFAEALGPLVVHGPEDELRAHVAECGAHLGRMIPALGRRLPDLPPVPSGDADTERFGLFTAVVGLLRRVGGERPVVLVLDDMQWADTASLQLLRHVAADASLRLLVLGTYRDTEVNTGHVLVETLGALWRMERVSRIDLRGLDDVGVVDLLTAVAGHGLDDAGMGLAHAVYRETDGNPFFVTEVLRHLAESGAIYLDDSGRWTSDQTLGDLRLPDSVREVVGARVGRLGTGAARVLSTAAVIGRDFDLELLAVASDLDEDDVLDLLEQAERAALVREPSTVAGRFVFTHAMIQRTLYEDLSATRRARAHQRVAEALEGLTAGRPGERIEELARHWAEATGPSDTTKAIDYAAQAGAAALDALAAGDAVRWYEQALELLGPDGDPHRRAELLAGLGEAQRDDANPEYRTALLEAAHLADATDDVNLLAHAALANTRGFQSSIGDTDTERVTVIERALDRLGQQDPVKRAGLLALAAVEQIYSAPLEHRLALVREAITLARASGDRHTLVDATRFAANAVHAPSTLDERLGWAREAVAAAEELKDLYPIYLATFKLRDILFEASDRDGVDELTRRMDGQVERLPPNSRWRHRQSEAWIALLDGDIDQAERLAEQALDIGLASGQPDAFRFFGAQFASVREAQGRSGELVALVEDALRETPGLAVFRAVLAHACAEAGDLERVRDLLTEARAAGFPMIEDGGWLSAQKNWAKAAVAVGDLDSAAAMWGRMAPYRDQPVFTMVTVSPVAGHYVGRLEHLLGRLDDADASFARAHAIHHQLRAPQYVARTEVRWAQMLVDRAQGDDHDRARTLATTARDASTDRPGWDWIERDAQAILDQLT